MKPVVKSFQQNRWVRLAKERMLEERLRLCCIRNRRFFKEHVFSRQEGFQCPFVVEAVGEGDVYAIYGRVGDQVWYV